MSQNVVLREVVSCLADVLPSAQRNIESRLQTELRDNCTPKEILTFVTPSGKRYEPSATVDYFWAFVNFLRKRPYKNEPIASLSNTRVISATSAAIAESLTGEEFVNALRKAARHIQSLDDKGLGGVRRISESWLRKQLKAATKEAGGEVLVEGASHVTAIAITAFLATTAGAAVLAFIVQQAQTHAGMLAIRAALYQALHSGLLTHGALLHHSFVAPLLIGVTQDIAIDQTKDYVVEHIKDEITDAAVAKVAAGILAAVAFLLAIAVLAYKAYRLVERLAKAANELPAKMAETLPPKVAEEVGRNWNEISETFVKTLVLAEARRQLDEPQKGWRWLRNAIIGVAVLAGVAVGAAVIPRFAPQIGFPSIWHTQPKPQAPFFEFSRDGFLLEVPSDLGTKVETQGGVVFSGAEKGRSLAFHSGTSSSGATAWLADRYSADVAFATAHHVAQEHAPDPAPYVFPSERRIRHWSGNAAFYVVSWDTSDGIDHYKTVVAVRDGDGIKWAAFELSNPLRLKIDCPKTVAFMLDSFVNSAGIERRVRSAQCPASVAPDR